MKTPFEPQPSPSRLDTLVHYPPLLSLENRSWRSSCPSTNQRGHSQSSVCLERIPRLFPDWCLEATAGWRWGQFSVALELERGQLGFWGCWLHRYGSWEDLPEIRGTEGRKHGCCGGTLLESLSLLCFSNIRRPCIVLCWRHCCI